MSDQGAWIGRTTEARDVASPEPLRQLGALVDLPSGEQATVPPLGHWVYFLPVFGGEELGMDGHPRLGRELPDLGFPRRMWAGSRVEFVSRVPVGAPLVRRSTIRSIDHKEGRSGRFAVVTIRHDISCHGALAITEEQDLIYREAASPRSDSPEQQTETPPSTDGAVTVHRFSEVELFLFSSLTRNAHRIHYDRDYAQAVEGYPDLVVQGPLLAMHLLAHFVRQCPEMRVRSFSFRIRRPVFCREDVTIGLERSDNDAALWLRSGRRGTSATATLALEWSDERP